MGFIGILQAFFPSFTLTRCMLITALLFKCISGIKTRFIDINIIIIAICHWLFQLLSPCSSSESHLFAGLRHFINQPALWFDNLARRPSAWWRNITLYPGEFCWICDIYMCYQTKQWFVFVHRQLCWWFLSDVQQFWYVGYYRIDQLLMKGIGPIRQSYFYSMVLEFHCVILIG